MNKTAKWNDPEYKRRYFRDYRKKNEEKLKAYQRDYNREKMKDAEYREKWNTYRRAYYKRPDVREKVKEYVNKKYRTDLEFRQKHLNDMKERYKNDEEFREKMKLYSKNYYHSHKKA
jgi:hypothetical protein